MAIRSSGEDAGLRSIAGGRRPQARIGGVQIVAAATGDCPFAVDAIAAEEDRWLTLSSDPRAVHAPGHPVRVMTKVWEAQPEAPGSVVIKSGTPLRLLAVVHDLDEEPSWRREWVSSALDAIFEVARKRHVSSLAVPLLGTRYGALPEADFMELLRDALHKNASRSDDEGRVFPQRVWLVTDSDRREQLVKIFAG